MGSIVETIKHL